MNRLTLFLILSGFILNSCCDKDFVTPLDYDFFEGAMDVTHLINSCSADAAFRTTGATEDGIAGSCLSKTDPLYNVWFKFVAPQSTDVSIILQVGGSKGTQTHGILSLWSDKQTEIDCEYYYYPEEGFSLYYGSLTPGVVYYFSVDVENAAGRGTFSLCMTDSD